MRNEILKDDRDGRFRWNNPTAVSRSDSASREHHVEAVDMLAMLPEAIKV